MYKCIYIKTAIHHTLAATRPMSPRLRTRVSYIHNYHHLPTYIQIYIYIYIIPIHHTLASTRPISPYFVIETNICTITTTSHVYTNTYKYTYVYIYIYK